MYDTTNPSAEKKNKYTNFVKLNFSVDGATNKVKVTSTFSALGLKPQELLSFIVDFDEVRVDIK
eukprot:NODE_2880_length_850_cov_100.047441_g2382_i0.p2 GENE.NODE_2880_length_850_cov_100.047441_g2382_i0~~NODE_2880_length_850_cov_100.047441_g2382_i0.p2  ORF type:complete len:64 (+),score=11.26 NODE_2880_length_850_cov_100.047441_g2382_i0:159-350(+)